MKQRDPSSKFMAALRKSGAAGYHKSKKINQIRKKKHKKRKKVVVMDRRMDRSAPQHLVTRVFVSSALEAHSFVFR